MRLKYGPVGECGPAPRKHVFATGETFHELGGAIVYVNASGNMAAGLAATAALFGYGLFEFSPEQSEVTGDVGSRIFTTGTLKSYAVVRGSFDGIWMPADANYARATNLATDCDIVVTSSKQMADIGTSVTNVLRIVDGVEGSAEVLVNIILNQVAQI